MVVDSPFLLKGIPQVISNKDLSAIIKKNKQVFRQLKKTKIEENDQTGESLQGRSSINPCQMSDYTD